MSTEETSVQTKTDRAWSAPWEACIPYEYKAGKTESASPLKHGSNHQHLQAQRPQSQGLFLSISKAVIAVILWTGFGASIYLLFTT